MQQEAAYCAERGAGLTVAESECGPVISWPGYGILFFWQLGVLQYLETVYDLSTCTMVGSSAGSMLSVLAACNIQPQAALDLAHQLCIEHRVFDRPLGLLGVWGGIVRQWLDILLPEDAVERCRGRVRIVITTLPFFKRQVVTDFKDRADLMDCCLASSHVPFFLDWQPAAVCRGQRCVDGSMLYILTGRCHGLRPTSHLSSLLLFDPFSDRQLLRGWNLLRCVLLCGKDGAQQLLRQGFEHAQNLDSCGALKALNPYRRAHMAPVKLEPSGGSNVSDCAVASSDPQCTHTQEEGRGLLERVQLSKMVAAAGGAAAGGAAAAAGGGDCGATEAVLSSVDSGCSSTNEFCVDAVAVIAEAPEASKPC